MTLALEGIKVIEVATMAAAPMAGRLLGDWGADIIHIEHPLRGDPWRTWLTNNGIPLTPAASCLYWENYARNKKSMTLDISQPRGQEVLLKLTEDADVFLTNMRPYEIAKFNIGYETISRTNSRLIYASLTGGGRNGPEKDAPGHDTVMFWVRSGLMYMMQQNGMPPRSPGTQVLACGDVLTSLGLAGGIILALFMRERTGVGQEVDMSLLHTGIFACAQTAIALGTDEEPVRRTREENPPLTNSYETRDGRWLQLSLSPPDTYWSGFCRVIEHEDLEHDPKFESFESRTQNQVALLKILEKTFRLKDFEEWKIRLIEARMLWAPVSKPQEVIHDPQARANDVFIPFDHPTCGHVEEISNPIKLSKAPSTIRTPAPEFGQHTEEILLGLGYKWEEIGQLKQQGVI